MSLSIEEEKPPSDYPKTWPDESPSIAQQQKALKALNEIEKNFFEGSKVMLEQDFKISQDFCEKVVSTLCLANKDMANSEQCQRATWFCNKEKAFKELSDDFVNFVPKVFVTQILTIIEKAGVDFEVGNIRKRIIHEFRKR